MQPSVVVHGQHSSALLSFGFTQNGDYHHEDSEGTQHFSEDHAILIMPHRTQSPKPNLSVRTHELVSMPRRREDAPLNSHPHIMMGEEGHQTLSHFEMARLERDRRDWRELAQFLRTNDPPRTNNMSFIEDEQRKKKKHAGSLTMFRRTAAKKSPSKGPVKPLQLPDSAVAARTTKGHWHIAISIPLSAISTFADEPASPRNRVVDEAARPGSDSTLPPAYRPASAQNNRSGKISPTPSQNSIHPALREEQSLATIADERDPNDTLTGEAANVMKRYYRQERLQNNDAEPQPGPQSLGKVLSSSKRSSQTSPTSSATSPLMKRGTFGTTYATSNDIERNNSQRTDSRHSGGTVYSHQTQDTMGHSRGPSAGSATGQMPDTIAPPPRSSSRQTRHSHETSRETATPASPPRKVQRAGSTAGRMEKQHKNVGPGDSASSIAMLEATEGLQHQLASMSVRNAPRTPAPTRALPDLPEEGGCPNHLQHGRSVSDGGKRPSPITRQQAQNVKERWEKVKALKMRDIERQRRRSTHPPLTASIASAPRCRDVNSNSEEGKRPKTPKRGEMRSARHAASIPFINAAANAAANASNGGISLSPIRTIASTSPSGVQAQAMYSCATPTSTSQSLPDDFLDSLLPSYDYHRLSSVQRHSNGTHSTHISSQPMTEGRRGSARSGRSDRTLRTFTPPRSLSPSFASSDEDGIHVTSPHSMTSRHNSHRGSHILRTSSNTSKKRNSALLYRNRSSVNSVEDEKEIKERMKRLERDNERILKTLQAMVGMQQGVKELCELLSPARSLTAGEKTTRGVSRTLEDAVPKPLSLRSSPRNSGREEDMKRRMRELEIEMAAGSLGHRVGETECEELVEERMENGGGWEELSAVEPLMREVRMNARVSCESRRGCSDEDEGMGYSLLEQEC